MATARVLPSGQWRCLVFDGVENGKRKYKSFTAATKNDAELQAKQYLADPSRKSRDRKLTVKDAIERYISSKEGVLSPSTIYGYRRMQRNRYESIGKLKIQELTSEDMQKFISDTAKEKSAKYTANVYGLLSSSVAMFRPEAVFRITLPKRAVRRSVAPSDSDVQNLFESADDWLKICIALAAFCSMRRGEICALKYADITGDAIHIHADIVTDNSNVYHYKDMPKTSESVRTVHAPEQVIELLGAGEPEDFVVKKMPYAITKAFIALRNDLGIDIRFHDLRHYYASIGAVLGIPDTYLSDFGGWRRGSPVLKSTYQNAITDASERYSEVMKNHFGSLIRNLNKDAEISSQEK